MDTFKKNDLGILYPFVKRILMLDNWWPPSRYIGKSRKSVDIYIAIWWLFQFLCVILFLIPKNPKWFLIVVVPLLVFRLIDICLILLATLIVGYHRSITEWASANRTVFLVFMNGIEIIIIFAFFYYDLAVIFGVNSGKIVSLLDAIYFSVVTGTTLGYGDIHPTTVMSKLLAIFQPLALIFIVINMISYARGAHIKKDNFNCANDF